VTATITHTSTITTTPRVLQLAGMFDVAIAEKLVTTITASLPLDRPWRIGMVVGPSGSGKTSIARHFWPTRIVGDQRWSEGALIDDFPPGMGIRDIVGLLTAVGLGSPPAWMRPYRTLSNGEAFRASIARALAESPGALVVVDEFTSVVDRQVAQVASHAIQKTVRRGAGQFIAVSCHYDVEEWLQPDWVYDVATAEFRWRLVQPHPTIRVDVYPVTREAWTLFAHHHYLSGDLLVSARCFGAWIGKDLVGFTSYRHFPHARVKNIKMGHRLVVLPDYQGLGIGGRLDDWLGQHLWDQGYRYRNTVAHPALIHYYSTSPRWTSCQRDTKLYVAKTATRTFAPSEKDPRQLGTRTFEYRAPRARGGTS
jgi:GNAT superfamily N-acetyltransferase